MNHRTPGLYHGKHYTQYVEDIKQLKREERLDEAAQLLLGLIPAIEDEARAKRLAPAPWYYEQLAIVYRKQKRVQHELLILDRYAQVCQLLRVPGADAFVERRAKAQAMAVKQPQIGTVALLPLPALTAEAFAPPSRPAPVAPPPSYQAPPLQHTQPYGQTSQLLTPPAVPWPPPSARVLSPGERFIAWLGRWWRTSSRSGKLGAAVGALFLVAMCQGAINGGSTPRANQTPVAAIRNVVASGPAAEQDEPPAATDAPQATEPPAATATPRPTNTPKPTATPRPEPTATPAPATATLINGGNFRSGPGTAYDAIRQLDAGAIVYLKQTRIEGDQRWFLVTAGAPDGQAAWLSSTLLDVAPSIAKQLPVNTARFTPPTPKPVPTAEPVAKPAPARNCHPSYPDVCIPGGPDLNCPDVPYVDFRVIGADPHGFDRDRDGIGCES